ncbi:MAG: CRISPR-associated helicase Cas3', partial [Chloroflexi bacterium]
MQLYKYQVQVADKLQSGQSVILQAPTGAGKTLAALWPFLEAWDRGNPDVFPRKCIYSVPMRVLANQFVQDTTALVRDKMVLAENPGITIQTGDRPEDPQFEQDLIFATIDQTLSSFLHLPYSLPRKLANLNAGAIVASYLVFDEFHLFDPDSTLPTALEMLRMLRGVAPFILMTATFSNYMLKTLGSWLDAAVIPANEEELKDLLNLPAEKSKRRYFHWLDQPMNAAAILERHQGHHRSLVVCNTVDRAQKIYRELVNHPERGDTEILLLHSRFLPYDRLAKEQRLLSRFGKNADRQSGSVIAVATQVIEVGLDISAEILHTELAPANAVLQRAGRCARYAGETGNVFVYPVENYLPYAPLKGSTARHAVIERTREWLANHPESEPVDFLLEQDWINAAHAEFDESLLQALQGGRSVHRKRMEAALAGRSNEAGELIRKISAVSVTISRRPDRWLSSPFSMPVFSLYPGTLYGAAKRWLEMDIPRPDGGLLLGKLVEDKATVEEEGEAVHYRWEPVTNTKALAGAPLVVVHPSLASYSTEEGLVLNKGGSYWDEDALLSPRKDRPASKGRRGWSVHYKAESYRQHIQLVYRAFNHLWPDLQRAADLLEKRAGWPAGTVRRAAVFAVLFHDVGKLRVDWQEWAAEWQKRINGGTVDFYAHTDYDREHHQQLERQMKRRPPHAVESAVAVSPLLAAVFGTHRPAIRAVFSAIARHHGAFSSNGTAFQLVEGAVEAVRQTLPLASSDLNLNAGQVNILTRGQPLRQREQDLLFVNGQ